MSASRGLLVHARDFIIDYIGRHRHPVNALLHIIGVPAAFYGIYELFGGSSKQGLALLFVGYLMQYFGHRAQGNEVGEVTLIKKIFKKIARRERSEAQ